MNRLLFFVLLAATSIVAGQPQTKADKVQAVLRAIEQTERTINQRLLPALWKQKAASLLQGIGAQEGLGDPWKSGNPHWMQAEAVIIKDLTALAERVTPRQRQDRTNLEEQLNLLSDSELLDVFRFHTGDLFPKMLRQIQASVKVLASTVEMMDAVRNASITEDEAVARLERLKAEGALSPEDQARLDKAFDSPGMRALRRTTVNISDVMAAISEPDKSKLSQDAVRQLSAIVSAYRKSAALPQPIRPRSPSPSASPEKKEDLVKALMDAVNDVDLDQVRILIAEGADVNALDDPNRRSGEAALHKAARRGSIDLAHVLLEGGAKVNVAGKTGFTPLHVASGLNRRAIAEYLISRGADINAMDYNGGPLHVAVVQGHDAIVELLLAYGANVNLKTEFGATPLHMVRTAATYYPSHTRIVRRLADAGADLFAMDKNGIPAISAAARSHESASEVLNSNAKLETDPPDRVSIAPYLLEAGHKDLLKEALAKGLRSEGRDLNGRSLLHVAARRGDVDLISELTRKGLDVDSRDSEMKTPLFEAILQSRYDAAQVLIDLGADVNAQNKRGQNVLFMAARTAPIAFIELLLRRSPAINQADADGRTPVHVLAQWGAADRIGLLVKHGASIGARDMSGNTVLHLARTSAAVKALIDASADVNALNASGEPPIFGVIVSDSDPVGGAEFLKQAGARLDIKAKDGGTLLHYSTRRGGVKGMEWVLSVSKIDVNAQMVDGRTPLHLAVANDHAFKVGPLLAKGANPNAQDKNGDTPLHLAAGRSSGELSGRILVQHGAKIDVRNHAGLTAEDIARRRGNSRFVEAIKQASEK